MLHDGGGGRRTIRGEYRQGASGALGMLTGESAGLAIDFTGNQGLGQVGVKDTTTPANNKGNVPVDQFLTQSSTTPKLVLGADGLYHWSPHNLILQSETFNNAAWTANVGAVTGNAAVAPDGTLTADKFTPNNAGFGAYLNTTGNIAVIAGATYAFSARVKAAGFNFVMLHGDAVGAQLAAAAVFDLATGVVASVSLGSASIAALGSGWYLCTVTGLNSAAGIAPFFRPYVDASTVATGDGVSGVYVWGAQLNRGAVPTAYHVTTASPWFGVPIEYSGGGYYAVTEPQAINYLTQSQEFGSNWAKNGVTVSPNLIAAPDGTLTAEGLVEDLAAAAYHETSHTVVVGTSGVVYVASVFMKQAGRRYAYVTSGNADTGGVFTGVFDLQTGTVASTQAFGATTGTSAAIQSATDGWYRCSVTQTQNVTAGVFIGSSATATPIYVGSVPVHDGNGALATYIWQAQLELGSVATSPIPTYAATVTRPADNINYVLTAIPFSLTAGTVFAEFSTKADGEQNVLHIGGFAPRIRIEAWGGSGNQVVAQVYDGTSFSFPLVAGTLALNTFHKTALAYTLTGATAAVDGVAGPNAVYAPSPVTLTGIAGGNIGTDPNIAVGLNGKVRKFWYVPRTMTNIELVAKTTL